METDNFWEIKNDELTARFKEYSDEKLVALLWEGNDDAWEYVYLRGVIPTLKSPKLFSIMRDRRARLSSREVLSTLLVTLLGEEKLALFKFRGSFFRWIRKYVLGIVLRYCKKNPWPVSDNPCQETADDKDGPKNLSEELLDAEKCFVKLWRTNPVRAYVHLLRIQNDMSSREIQTLLDLSSVQNVNKYFERACEDMRKFRDKLDNGEEL